MDIEKDSLRICPKCKRTTHFDGESKTVCQSCGGTVWFFNYKKLVPPGPPPGPDQNDAWKKPTFIAMLAVSGVMALVAIVSITNQAVLAVVCSLIAITFSILAMLKHAEVVAIKNRLEHAEKVDQYAASMRARLADAVNRYNALLRTGDTRVEVYFEQIFGEAQKERIHAEQLRANAATDLAEAKQYQDRTNQMAAKFLDDHRKWVATKLRADPESYQRHKTNLEKAFRFVESVGYRVSPDLRTTVMDDLKRDYRAKVYEQRLKDEQRELKARLREEARIERERARELQESEVQEAELQRRLEEALSDQGGSYTQEIEELQRQLAEAHARSERAKSMAQLTKCGHVYVLSNIGTFGENIYKIGMTRRLEPSDRVRELGDASVPFPFDVHVMISCDNAPGLENALHRELTRYRVNRVNLRKEYFNVSLEAIMDAVQRHHGKVEYVAEPEALEYRESLTISPESLIEVTQDLEAMGVDFNEDDEELVEAGA